MAPKDRPGPLSAIQHVTVGPLHIQLCTLVDLQQYDDDQGVALAQGISSAQWSMFGVVWSASHVLAHAMLGRDIEELRILEVGCGIALPSLVLSQRGADITATDLHTSAEAFLQRNVALNHTRPIPFERLRWGDTDSLGTFHLIIASDILYERGQAADLARFMAAHARPKGRVLMADAGRNYLGQFVREMGKQNFQQLSRQQRREGAHFATLVEFAYG